MAKATRLVIIGRRTSGKTTVFKALTGPEVATGTVGASGDEPNLATVRVPDPWLDKLIEIFNPKAKVQSDVQYLDVDGIAVRTAMEIGQLEGEDAEMLRADPGIAESAPGRIIRLSFDPLGLQPFFIVGPVECRA